MFEQVCGHGQNRPWSEPAYCAALGEIRHGRCKHIADTGSPASASHLTSSTSSPCNTSSRPHLVARRLGVAAKHKVRGGAQLHPDLRLAVVQCLARLEHKRHARPAAGPSGGPV